MYFRRGAAVVPAAAAARRLALPGGNECILVVEDEDSVRSIVTEQLRSLGYSVKHAANADQALDCLRVARFDLLLTDVMMPGRLNGKGLSEEVERQWPDTRIVFMSGYSENALQHDGQLDSGVRLLPKPHRKADLAKIIRSALGAASGGPGLGRLAPSS